MTYAFAIVAVPAAVAAFVALVPVRRVAAVVLANAAIAASFLLALALRAGDFHVAVWAAAGPVRVPLGFLVDPLSRTFALIVTGVAFLIHVYSAGYMAEERDFRRYWSALNAFVAAMLLLVLADGFVLLLVGWAGVGLASYLLIGFWYERPRAVAAARKAFLINVAGDVAILIAIFVLQAAFGSVAYRAVLPHAATAAGAAGAAALLLLVGAAAKSAQLPLHTWLADAMEGPTPVSALIHAATMVTAGVYLIARIQPLFAAAPAAGEVAAAVGGATALLAAGMALAQMDLKRVLAYSTMSQVGYMVMGASIGALGAAVSHVAVHAFFKALLFMGAGCVMHALGGDERDMRLMGGLARRLPGVAWFFGIGAVTLAGGFGAFWSKDAIIASLRAGHPLLWAVGLLTAFLTAMYAFRMFFLVFTGEYRGRAEPQARLPLSMTWPAWVLAGASVLGGFAAVAVWRRLGQPPSDPLTSALSLALELLGFGVAWRLYRHRGLDGDAWLKSRLGGWLRAEFGFDAAYAALIVRPGEALAGLVHALDDASFRAFGGWAGQGVRAAGEGLRSWQSGYIRKYALSVLIGALFALAWAVVMRGAS